MNTIISNEIIIEHPSEDIAKWCENNLVYKNPEYYKKLRMGMYIGKTPSKIYNYKKNDFRLYLPFGVINKVWKFIKKEPFEVQFKAKRIYPVSNIKLYDYQEKAVENLVKAKNGILVSSAGSGKGHPLDTLLYTPTGTTKIGDLKIGDSLIGRNGEKIKVTNIFDRGLLDTYKVTFSDGTWIECDEEHLFNVQTKTERDSKLDTWHTYEVRKIKKILETKKTSLFIPIVEPVKFNSQKVDLDPWLLGALIGDGGLSTNSVIFSNNEQDVIEKVKSKLKSTEKMNKRKNTYDYSITSISHKEKSATYYSLKKYGLIGKHSYEKHIPDEYKYNDIDTRLQLLQGIIDTDGSVEKNGEITLTTTSKKLAEDVVEIVQSLGGTAKIAIRHTKYTHNGEKRLGRESYRVYIKIYKYIPFTSKKHFSKFKKRTKYTRAYRKIMSIEYIGKKEIRCISVNSKDCLYVAKDFIVTHNTVSMLETICRLGFKALWITNKTDLLNQAYDTAKKYIQNVSFGKITEGKIEIADITFATVQTLSRINLQEYKDEWAVIVCDEVHNVCSNPAKIMQFSKVISSLSARFKFGCTATLHRNDGLEGTILDLIGNVAYEVPKEEIADKIIKAEIQPVHTNYSASILVKNADGTMTSFVDLISEICENEERNELILKYLRQNSNKHCLVLSDRVKQLEYLQAKLGEGVVIKANTASKKAKEQRVNNIEAMREGKEKYLFATYSLAKEGLDIPILDRLFLCTPKKDLAVVIQSIGRIERKHENKETPIAYDFVDSKEGMFENMYKSRKRIYKKNNNKIKEEE